MGPGPAELRDDVGVQEVQRTLLEIGDRAAPERPAWGRQRFRARLGRQEQILQTGPRGSFQSAPFPDGNENRGFHAALGDDLRSFGDGPVQQLTEARLGFLHLPHPAHTCPPCSSFTPSVDSTSQKTSAFSVICQVKEGWAGGAMAHRMSDRTALPRSESSVRQLGDETPERGERAVGEVPDSPSRPLAHPGDRIVARRQESVCERLVGPRGAPSGSVLRQAGEVVAQRPVRAKSVPSWVPKTMWEPERAGEPMIGPPAWNSPTFSPVARSST